MSNYSAEAPRPVLIHLLLLDEFHHLVVRDELVENYVPYLATELNPIGLILQLSFILFDALDDFRSKALSIFVWFHEEGTTDELPGNKGGNSVAIAVAIAVTYKTKNKAPKLRLYRDTDNTVKV